MRNGFTALKRGLAKEKLVRLPEESRVNDFTWRIVKESVKDFREFPTAIFLHKYICHEELVSVNAVK